MRSCSPQLYFGGSPEGPSDDLLVDEAKRGNELAIAELWNRHGRVVRSTILRITCNWEDTEDVLQETYLNSYLHLDQFDGRSKFSTWLVRIAINSSLMLLRNSRRRRAVMVENSDLNTSSFDFPDKREDVESHHIRGQRLEHLWGAVRKLKAPLRQILELRYERELSVENIAEITNLSVPAVKSRLLRARIHLRDSLSRQRNTARRAVMSALNT